MFVSKDPLQLPVPIVPHKGRPPDPNRKCPVELRRCKRHGLTEFAYYSRGQGQRSWRCKRCVGEAVTRRKQKVKEMLIEEAGGCCAVCGYDRCVVALTFHHVDRDRKSFPMSMHTTKSLAAYREELEKCVLVCANCHGEIEAGLIVSPPPGATFEDVLYRYAWRFGLTNGGYAADMTEESGPRPDQEGFGKASLGEAQSSNPPPDPEMLEDVSEGRDGEGGDEDQGGDRDAEPTSAPEQVEEDSERDQAEG